MHCAWDLEQPWAQPSVLSFASFARNVAATRAIFLLMLVIQMLAVRPLAMVTQLWRGALKLRHRPLALKFLHRSLALKFVHRPLAVVRRLQAKGGAVHSLLSTMRPLASGMWSPTDALSLRCSSLGVGLLECISR